MVVCQKKSIREIKEGLDSIFSDKLISFCGAFFKKRPDGGTRHITSTTLGQIALPGFFLLANIASPEAKLTIQGTP